MQAGGCCSPGPTSDTSVFSYVPPLSLLKGKKEQVEERQGGDDIFDEHVKASSLVSEMASLNSKLNST